MRQHRHLGAYGVAIRGASVLLIRKGRGPFSGLWDLPGGGIEFGESPEAAVRREFREETGLAVTDLALVDAYHNRLLYAIPTGEAEDLHHIGLIYRVRISGEATLREGPDGHDSLGARWWPLDQLDPDSLTPFARRSLEADGRLARPSGGSHPPAE